MSHLVFGPRLDGVSVEATPVLPDLVVDHAVAVGRTVTVTIPSFDPAAVNPPVSALAVYLATPPDPAATPEQVMAMGAPSGSATVTAAGDVVISVAGVAAGTYTVVTILEYADPS